MAVGEVFKKRFPQGNLFFIQAGVPQPKAKLNQRGRVYSLPGGFRDRHSFRNPSHGPGVNVHRRTTACLDIVTQERPDLFITESFPCGRQEYRYELIPALIKASLQGCVLWGVVGYPLLIGEERPWRDKILKLYTRIIIFAPSMEKELMAASLSHATDRKTHFEFFERHSSKITFAGYLLPQQAVVRDDEDENIPKPLVPREAHRVTIVRGGGVVYPKLIAEGIRASDLLGGRYYFTVVAGPSTTPQEWYFFASLVGKKKVHNLVLLRSVGDYEGLIKRSDVCVSMASYHTCVMLLKYQKKAVVIPFEGYGSMVHYEQPARSALLKEKIGAKILSIQDLTALSLADAIEGMVRQPQGVAAIPEEWFKGGNILEEALTGLVAR